jgi:hypothetical protein
MDDGFCLDQVRVACQGGRCGGEHAARENDGAEQLQHNLEGIGCSGDTHERWRMPTRLSSTEVAPVRLMVMPVQVGGGVNWWQFLRGRRELREESNRRRRELRNPFQDGPMPPDVCDAFERLEHLRAKAAEVLDAEVAAFRSLTDEQVVREADRVMADLDERRRIEGHAETLSATEDDDWVKLHGFLNECDASSIRDLRPEIADQRARRMAVHARRRGATADSFK